MWLPDTGQTPNFNMYFIIPKGNCTGEGIKFQWWYGGPRLRKSPKNLAFSSFYARFLGLRHGSELLTQLLFSRSGACTQWVLPLSKLPSLVNN